jgi:DNA-binding protein HU-beta
MNRSELVAAVASNGGFGKSDAEKIVDCLLAAIADALKRGDEVRLTGFGTFTVASRAAGQARNPRTGEPVRRSMPRNAGCGALLPPGRNPSCSVPVRGEGAGGITGWRGELIWRRMDGPDDGACAAPAALLCVGVTTSAMAWDRSQWVRQLGTSESDISYGVAADSENNVYISGSTGNVEASALA